MKKLILTICFAVAGLTMTFAQGGTMTNDAVINLLKEGRTTEEIISAIEKDKDNTITFDLKYMRRLKQAGADETLITYIQKICKDDNTYSGCYWWDADGGKPMNIPYSCFSKDKDGFSIGKLAGATITGRGALYIAQQAVKAGVKAAHKNDIPVMISNEKDFEHIYLPGKTSKTKVTSYNPVFRFYLPGRNAGSELNDTTAEFYISSMKDVQSADEFQLVLLDQKGKKRYFDSGCDWEAGGFEGKSRKHHYVQDFEVTRFNDNTFELYLVKPLKPGEYVFFWKNCLTNPYFQQHVFGFDFTVPKMKKKK